MPMNNPPQPGGIIRDCLHDLNLSVQVVADSFGLTRQQLHGIMSGKARITPATALKLEKAFGSTAATWLAMQSARDLALARAKTDLGNVHAYVTETTPKSPA